MNKLCISVFIFSVMLVNSAYATDPINRALGKYPIKEKSLEVKDAFGGKYGAVDYRYGYDVSQARLDGVPYAMYVGAEAAITVNSFGVDRNFFRMQSYLAANALTDTNKKIDFVTDVKILFITLWKIPGIDGDFGGIGTRKEYWSSKDRWGKEKYRVYKSKEFSFPIVNPFLPLTADFNLGGAMGHSGSLYQYSSRYPDLRFEI